MPGAASHHCSRWYMRVSAGTGSRELETCGDSVARSAVRGGQAALADNDARAEGIQLGKLRYAHGSESEWKLYARCKQYALWDRKSYVII